MTTPAATATWSAPVRFAEVDRQGVVFNAHYLTWCDEALAAFLERYGLAQLGEHARLVACSLTWSSAARYGDVVSVDVTVARLGRTSFTLAFEVRVGERRCCSVETTYVAMDESGKPTPLTEAQRTQLT